MFWALDAYFLRQERLFRKLYDRIRTLDSSKVDFSMRTTDFENAVGSIWKVGWSPTLKLFHCTLTGSIIVVMVLMIAF